MKLKRTIGLVLAAVMVISGLNFSYANEPPNTATMEITDKVTTGSAIEPNLSENRTDLLTISETSPITNEEFDITYQPQTIASDTDLVYAVEGGNIYFDKSTGTITGCDESVTSAVIPSTINGIDVTSIGDYAFSSCNKLASIKIPNCVTSIGDNTFSACSSLTSIEIPNCVTSIGNYAFSWCSKLASIEMPNSLISIGSNAFEGCSSLVSIKIPNNITYIEGSIFLDCSSLSNIEIPSSVTSIGSDAFSGCSSLASIEIPSSVTSIGSDAFENCSSLTSIVIPSSVISFEDHVFANCSSLKTAGPIGGGYDYEFAWVDKIPNSAFSGCNGLISINIPSSVTSIGRSAFGGCSSLPNIEIPSSVTSIEVGAFYGCSSLPNIEIPNSVTSIGSGAFHNCSSLTSIEIPSSVTYIERSLFAGCNSLTNIEIPSSVTFIGDDAFRDCSSLTSIEIPSSVSSIKFASFKGCSSLTNIEIPSSVTSIESCAFEGCSSLINIDIPSNVTSIGVFAFAGCNSLTNIEIPSNITTIEKSAFEGCSSLTSIIIQDGVIRIRDFAFWNCDSLTSIVIPSSVTSISRDVFLYTLKNKLMIYTTEGSYADKWAENNDFKVSYDIPDGAFAKLNSNMIYLKEHYIGDTARFYAASKKSDSSAPLNVTWSSTDNSIANIVPSGESRSDSTYYYYDADVNFIGEGEVTITATAENGSSVSFPLTVTRKRVEIDKILINGKARYDTANPTKDIEVSIRFSEAVRLNKDAADITDNFSIDSDKETSGGFEESHGKAASVLSENVTQTDDNTIVLKFENTEFLPNLTAHLGEGVLVPVNSEYLLNLDSIFPVELSSYDSTKQYNVEVKKTLDIKEASEQYNKALQYYRMYTRNELVEKYPELVEGYEKMIPELDALMNGQFPDAQAKEACRKALYYAIKDLSDSNVEINDLYSGDPTEMGLNIVNEVLKSMSSVEYVFDESGYEYKATVNIFGFQKTRFGSIYYEKKNTKNGAKTGTIAVVSTEKQAAEAIKTYFEELSDTTKTALADAVNSIIDEYSKAFCIEDFINENTKKRLKKSEAILKEAGLGDIAEMFEDSQEVCENINKILKSNTDAVDVWDGANALASMDIDFIPSGPEPTNKDYKNLKEARKNLIEAAICYRDGKEAPDIVDRVVDWVDKIFWNCPVDVYIYDENNNEIGSIVGGEITKNSDSIELDKNGDTKTLYILDDAPVTFKLKAYDYGMLNVTEEKKTDGIISERNNFYNIPLDPGDELGSNVIVPTSEELIITTPDGEVKADDSLGIDDDGGVDISVTAENGYVTGAGTYAKGDTVTLIANPDVNYSFVGWYNRGNLIKVSTLYNFTARENLNLTAVFEKVDTLNTPTTSESTTETTSDSPDETTDAQTESTTETTSQNAPESSSETTSQNVSENSSETTSHETSESSQETTTTKPTNSGSSSGGGGSSSGRGSSRKSNTTTATTEAATETTTEAAVKKESTKPDTKSAVSSEVRITIGSKNVILGDKTYTIDAVPYIQASSNSALVPLRFVSVALLGEDVANADTSKLISWDAATKTATVNVNNKIVKFTVGSPYMIIYGKSQLMENNVKAEIKDGRMYIPFRALGTALGVKVDWEAETKTAIYKVQ